MMKEQHNKIDRRDFLKTMGAAGLTPAFGGVTNVFAEAKTKTDPKAKEPKLPQVPKRKLGKTGVEVPCLSLGGAFNILDNQIMLRKTFEWGITYWDTADSYEGGNSELGIGKYLKTNPDVRKKLFIVTKAFGTKTVEDLEEHLQTSLKKMNTKYVDLYYIMDRVRSEHGLSDPSQLTDDLKQWAESAKKRKLIRFFGFSTHKNMDKCLSAAAKLGWIDAIMTTYNFRVMQDGKMQEAVEACYKAGVGLIAMKTQAGRQRIKTEEDKKLTGHFLERGFTEAQAKIKVVLDDKRISTVCSRMGNVAQLTENVAVVFDKTKLTQEDRQVFRKHSEATCSGYCAGCAHICDSALPDVPYVSDIMRYLMYYNSYGEQAEAREHFARIPQKVRNKLLSTDYSAAEARCPQHIPIAKLIAEAVSKLA
jgi:predicted aldo/keto reductase-like oxidoreductase